MTRRSTRQARSPGTRTELAAIPGPVAGRLLRLGLLVLPLGFLAGCSAGAANSPSSTTRAATSTTGKEGGSALESLPLAKPNPAGVVTLVKVTDGRGHTHHPLAILSTGGATTYIEFACQGPGQGVIGGVLTASPCNGAATTFTLGQGEKQSIRLTVQADAGTRWRIFVARSGS